MDIASSMETTNVDIGPVLGLLIGLALAVVIITVGVMSGKRSAVMMRLVKLTWLPLIIELLFLGTWIGFVLGKPEDPSDWYQQIAHGLLILTLAFGGWLWFSALGVMGDPTILTNVSTGRDARRYWTQAQVLQKAFRAVVVVMTIVFILLTFPEARAPMASVLASAGVVSVIAGLAAQTTLGNMFAGLQLAFTDAIRVGDTVMLEGQDQPGQVEEITLTYVVVRIWDGRRLILPSTEFTNKPFENWTRESASQIASFQMQLDWRAPVGEIRAEVGRLLEGSPNWDGRVWGVQVYEVSGPYIAVKVIVSAEDWAKAWDLRTYLRENLVDWVTKNADWAIPRDRVIVDSEKEFRPTMTTEEVVSSQLQGPQFSGRTGGGRVNKLELMHADPDEAIVKEVKQMPKVESGEISPQQIADKDAGSMLFAGSKAKEDMGSIYKGPGLGVFSQRIARRKARRERELSLPLSNEDGTVWKPDNEITAKPKELAADSQSSGSPSDDPSKTGDGE